MLVRLWTQAQARIGDFLTIEPAGPPGPQCGPGGPGRVVIDVAKGLRAGKGHLLRQVGRHRGRITSLTMMDSQRALMALARIYGMHRGQHRQRDGAADPDAFWTRLWDPLSPSATKELHLAMLQLGFAAGAAGGRSRRKSA